LQYRQFAALDLCDSRSPPAEEDGNADGKPGEETLTRSAP
jgi:hypothetical protein